MERGLSSVSGRKCEGKQNDQHAAEGVMCSTKYIQGNDVRCISKSSAKKRNHGCERHEKVFKFQRTAPVATQHNRVLKDADMFGFVHSHTAELFHVESASQTRTFRNVPRMLCKYASANLLQVYTIQIQLNCLRMQSCGMPCVRPQSASTWHVCRGRRTAAAKV